MDMNMTNYVHGYDQNSDVQSTFSVRNYRQVKKLAGNIQRAPLQQPNNQVAQSQVLLKRLSWSCSR